MLSDFRKQIEPKDRKQHRMSYDKEEMERLRVIEIQDIETDSNGTCRK